MFLKKTPKPKGTYLAITESYYDKEKKATRQKTIMGLGYLEELRKEFLRSLPNYRKMQKRHRKESMVCWKHLNRRKI